MIDASLGGTGIRDYYEGGYIAPEKLHLNLSTIKRLHEWQSRYENEHYSGFANGKVVDELDQEGKEIALTIKNELGEAEIEYFSDARMTKESL